MTNPNYHLTGYREWKTTINDHYGSIDGFDHAPTVRIFLRFLSEHETHCKEMIDAYAALTTCDDPKPIDFVFLSDEMRFMQEILAERASLLNWFEMKGLPV